MRHLFVLATLALGACAQAPATPGQLPANTGETVVTVNGEKLGEDVFNTMIGDPDQIQQLKDAGRWDQVVEQIALSSVLYHKALEAGVQNTEAGKLALVLAQRDALARELVTKVQADAASDAKVKAYYDEHPADYATPQVQARHILLDKEANDQAVELVEKLKAGGDFAVLAAEFSKDPGSKTRGGDLGWFKDGQMVPEFSIAAFGAEKNQIVGPVESQFGLHIIEVTDRRENIPLDDVKAEIGQRLKRTAVEEYIDAAKEEMDMTIAGADAAPAATPKDDGHGHPEGSH